MFFIAAIVVAIFAVGGIFFVLNQSDESNDSNQKTNSNSNVEEESNSPPEESANANPSETTITEAELASFTGKNGDKCYVAVDGVVYDATNADKWEDGVHTESNGLAKCGEDLSQVIKASPHGKSVLDDLKEVGNLEN